MQWAEFFMLQEYIVVNVHYKSNTNMEPKLFIVLFFSWQLLQAQTFSEVSVSLPFEGEEFSSIAFLDVDGDTDRDVLITGRNHLLERTAKLYFNEGEGRYREVVESPFIGVDRGDVAYADVENDGDLDVLIVGQDGIGTPTANLYLNDGKGVFDLALEMPFEGVEGGTATFVDVNGDGSQDVFLTGRDKSLTRISKLYINNGVGVYSEATGTSFVGVDRSSVAFADLNGDTFQDLLVTGKTHDGSPVSKLYTNDGKGKFTEWTSSLLESVESSSVAFADVDGDMDQDLLITGYVREGVRIAKLYLNNGGGAFQEDKDAPFEGVDFGSVAFSDVDGDKDQDILITGISSQNGPIAKLFSNDGFGVFRVVAESSFEGVETGAVFFADVDGDEDQDVLITGRNSKAIQIAQLYVNTTYSSSLDNLGDGLNFDFALYPNPSSVDKIILTYLVSESTLVKINVYDTNGRLMVQRNEQLDSGEQRISIDISSLASGSYVLQLADGMKMRTQKFLVQK